MPIDLTGQNISDIYSSFLHTGFASLCSEETPVYDGLGNISTLSLSTSSASLSNLKINQIEYPQSIGVAGGVVISDGVSKLSVASIASVLSTINSTVPQDGSYSAPVITIANGVISKIVSSNDNKTFFYPSRVKTVAGPSSSLLIEAIIWNNPLIGDKANVIQKVLNSDGSLNNIDINVFTYTASGWGSPQTY